MTVGCVLYSLDIRSTWREDASSVLAAVSGQVPNRCQANRGHVMIVYLRILGDIRL